MVEANRLRKEELVSRGRSAMKSGRFRAAYDFFSEYCGRQMAEEAPIPGPILADYAVSMAHLGDHQEAAQVCLRAIAADRRNADAYAALARVYLLSGARRKAIEAMERGFTIAPRSHTLNIVREEIGVRRSPVIPFLSRENKLNVLLGKLMERLRQKRRVA
jgi:tetratricopeptide (TPR) repeat protein